MSKTSPSSKQFSYFCPCPRGLEAALAEELNEIAATTGTLKVPNRCDADESAFTDCLARAAAYGANRLRQ